MIPYNASHEGIIKPDPETDYHGHPNYTKIFLFLVLLLGVSLVAGYFISPVIGISLIFLTALVKAGLVVGNFMHLKFEPKFIWMVVGIVLFIISAFYFGVLPDITGIERIVVK